MTAANYPTDGGGDDASASSEEDPPLSPLPPHELPPSTTTAASDVASDAAVASATPGLPRGPARWLQPKVLLSLIDSPENGGEGDVRFEGARRERRARRMRLMKIFARTLRQRASCLERASRRAGEADEAKRTTFSWKETNGPVESTEEGTEEGDPPSSGARDNRVKNDGSTDAVLADGMAEHCIGSSEDIDAAKRQMQKVPRRKSSGGAEEVEVGEREIPSTCPKTFTQWAEVDLWGDQKHQRQRQQERQQERQQRRQQKLLRRGSSKGKAKSNENKREERRRNGKIKSGQGKKSGGTGKNGKMRNSKSGENISKGRRNDGREKRGSTDAERTSSEWTESKERIRRNSIDGRERRGGSRERGRKTWKKHAFSLGQQARPCHMDAPSSPEDALVKIARLETGDGAWVRRTKGNDGKGDVDGYVWTYAILKKMSEDTLVFIVNDRGSFKECSVRHWKKCVRVVAPEYALEEEEKDRQESLDAFVVPGCVEPSTCEEPSDEAIVEVRDDETDRCMESSSRRIELSTGHAEPSIERPEFSTGEKDLVLVPDHDVSMYTLGAEGNTPPVVVLQDHQVSMYTLVGDGDDEDDASSLDDQGLDDHNISFSEHGHKEPSGQLKVEAGDEETGGRVEFLSRHAESLIGPEEPSRGRTESSTGEKELALMPDHEVSMYTLGADGDALPVVVLQDHEIAVYTLVGDGVDEDDEDDACSLDEQVLDDRNISVLEPENEEPAVEVKVEAGDDETGGRLESSSGHAESSIGPEDLSSVRVESLTKEKEQALILDHEVSMYTLDADGDAPPVVVLQDHEMSLYTLVGNGGNGNHEDDASLSKDQVLDDHNISVADNDLDISMYTFCAGMKTSARDGTAPAAETDVPSVNAKADRVPTPPSAETDGAKNYVPVCAPREGAKATGDESDHAATPPGQRANGVPICKPFAPTKAMRGPDSDRREVPRMGGAGRNRPSWRSVQEGVNCTATLPKIDFPMLCVPREGTKATRVQESNRTAKPRVGNVQKKRNASRSSENHLPSPPISILGAYGDGGGDPLDGKRKRRPKDPPAPYLLVRERNATYRSNDRDPPGAVSSDGLSSRSPLERGRIVPAKKPRGEAQEVDTNRFSSNVSGKAKKRRDVRRLTPISELPKEETGVRAENPEKGRLEELPPPAATDRSAGDGCKVKKNGAFEQGRDVPKLAGGQVDTKKNRKKPSRRTTGVQHLSKSLPPTKRVPISESCKEETGLGLGSSRQMPTKKTASTEELVGEFEALANKLEDLRHTISTRLTDANTTILQLSKSLPPTRPVENSTPNNEANFSSSTMTPAADDSGGTIEMKHDIQRLTEYLRNPIGHSACSGNGKEGRMLRDRKVSGYTLDCKTCDDSKDEQSSVSVFGESAVTIKHSNSASQAEYGKWTEPKDKLPPRPIYRHLLEGRRSAGRNIAIPTSC